MIRGGGIVIALGIGPLAAAAGVPLAWALTGVLLLLCGGSVLQIRPPRSQLLLNQRGKRDQALAASRSESSRESNP